MLIAIKMSRVENENTRRSQIIVWSPSLNKLLLIPAANSGRGTYLSSRKFNYSFLGKFGFNTYGNLDGDCFTESIQVSIQSFPLKSGYVITDFFAQGQTIDRVHMFFDPSSVRRNNGSVLVPISRARK